MNSFNRHKLEKPSDFMAGHLYEMSSGYHTIRPYYVQVIEIGEDYIITDIPDHHSLKIKIGENWDYHIERFTYIGKLNNSNHHLLMNQNLPTHIRS